MNKLIIISGPTATGKTKTSIDLANYILNTIKKDVAIINFDSLLFYKEISIGTAKPTKIEQKDIKHYLVDIESILNPLNASQYVSMAKNLIKELHQKNIIPILVGGSAFYLRALLKGMYESITIDSTIKEETEKLYKKEGILPIIEFLKSNDPEVFQYLHENDHYRLIRAFEFYKMNNSKISEQKKLLDENDPYDFTKINEDWHVLHFYLDLPKDAHLEIIQKRTENMVQNGLLDEVKSILDKGFDPHLKPLQSIGYKEIIDFFEGKYSSIEECVERISISTRQLAKSQRTFFKKIHPKVDINPLNDFDRILEITTQFL